MQQSEPCFSQHAPAAHHELPCLLLAQCGLCFVLIVGLSVSPGEISLATLQAKQGTIIPLATAQPDWWEVVITCPTLIALSSNCSPLTRRHTPCFCDCVGFKQTMKQCIKNAGCGCIPSFGGEVMKHAARCVNLHECVRKEEWNSGKVKKQTGFYLRAGVKIIQ